MSDYETKQKHRNITVGIFVILATCAFGWLVYQFGDLPLAVSELRSFQVRVQFPSAQGIQENTPVNFCGYQIGRVTAIEPPALMKEVDGNRVYHQTIVVLSIDKTYSQIPDDVQVKVMTRGLGSSFIEIKQKFYDVNKPNDGFLTEKSILQGSTGTVSDFFPEESQKKLESLVDDLKILINNTNDIIGNEANKSNVQNLLLHLSEASTQATETLKEVKKFSSVGIVMSENLSKLVVELQSVTENIRQGRGSAGRFINDARLYEKLLENAEQLRLTLKEIRNFISESSEKGVPLKLK